MKTIIDNGKIESINTGSIICNEGDIADKVYLILPGKVKVYKNDIDGNENELATLEKGNMF